VTEAGLHRACAALAGGRGAWLVKLLPSVTGLPDALLVSVERIALVELKTPRGRLSPRQRAVFRRLWEDYGIEVHIVRTPAEFTKLLDALGEPQ